MAGYKRILIGLGVVAALVGGLLATGVVKLNRSSDDPERRGDESDLESLAYLGEVPLAEGTHDLAGVERNEPGSYEGFLLANAASGGGPNARAIPIREAVLYDSDGKQVNRWQSDLPSQRRGWAIARMDSSGYLYAVVADGALLKLDWDSNIVWLAEGRFHHDLTVLEDDSVAVLAERVRVVDGPGRDRRKVRLLEHGVVFFTPDGQVYEQVWFYDIFKRNVAFQAAVRRAMHHRGEKVIAQDERDLRGYPIDAFHANSIVVLPRDVEGLGRKGDYLVSLRNMNTVALIDYQTLRSRWVWGPRDLFMQHDATLTAEGHIVLFDNRNPAENSRAVIVDPSTSTIVRTIGGPDATGTLKFYSRGRGIAQWLPNGNVMVVVSNEGRAFEVDADDEVLWEFWSPWKDAQTRKPIRATRLEGKAQTAAAAIVAGIAPAPSVAPDSMRRWTVDLGGPPPQRKHPEPGPG